MNKSWGIAVFLACVMCAVLGLFSGCETGGGTTGLSVTPSSVNTTNKSEAITFTVGTDTNTTAESGLRDLSLPLEWSLSNPALGYISAEGGYSCVYVRHRANGIQTITVVDQYGSRGQATVDQQ